MGASDGLLQSCKSVHGLEYFEGNKKSCNHALQRQRAYESYSRKKRGTRSGPSKAGCVEDVKVDPKDMFATVQADERMQASKQSWFPQGSDCSTASDVAAAFPAEHHVVEPMYGKSEGMDAYMPPGVENTPLYSADMHHEGLPPFGTGAQEQEKTRPMSEPGEKAASSIQSPSSAFLTQLSITLFGAAPFHFTARLRESLLRWLTDMPIGIIKNHMQPASFSRLTHLAELSASLPAQIINALERLELPLGMFTAQTKESDLLQLEPAVCALTTSSELRIRCKKDLSSSDGVVTLQHDFQGTVQLPTVTHSCELEESACISMSELHLQMCS